MQQADAADSSRKGCIAPDNWNDRIEVPRPLLTAGRRYRRLLLGRTPSAPSAEGEAWSQAWARSCGATAAHRAGGLALCFSRPVNRAVRLDLLRRLRREPGLAGAVLGVELAARRRWQTMAGTAA